MLCTLVLSLSFTHRTLDFTSPDCLAARLLSIILSPSRIHFERSLWKNKRTYRAVVHWLLVCNDALFQVTPAANSNYKHNNHFKSFRPINNSNAAIYDVVLMLSVNFSCSIVLFLFLCNLCNNTIGMIRSLASSIELKLIEVFDVFEFHNFTID